MTASTSAWTRGDVEDFVHTMELYALDAGALSGYSLTESCDRIGIGGLLLNRDASPYLLADDGVLIARLLSALQTLNDERLVRRSQEG